MTPDGELVEHFQREFPHRDVDHNNGRLVWAAAGRDNATLNTFFEALRAERSAQITHVFAEGADWIAAVLAERCRTR